MRRRQSATNIISSVNDEQLGSGTKIRGMAPNTLDSVIKVPKLTLPVKSKSPLTYIPGLPKPFDHATKMTSSSKMVSSGMVVANQTLDNPKNVSLGRGGPRPGSGEYTVFGVLQGIIDCFLLLVGWPTNQQPVDYCHLARIVRLGCLAHLSDRPRQRFSFRVRISR